MQSAIPKVYQHAVSELRESKAMSRLAGFQSREWIVSASAKGLM
jgi:hypothetical protein